MTMPFFAIKCQHPVRMPTALHQVTEPTIGGQRVEVRKDQKVRVTVSLGSGHSLRDPTQRLGHPSPRQHVEEQSPEYGQKGIAAAKRVRQPQRRMQAVPDFPGM